MKTMNHGSGQNALVDHTGLQRLGRLSKGSPSPYRRWEFLQSLEHLLIFDRTLLSSTEVGDTLNASLRILEDIATGGLYDGSSNGVVHCAMVLPAEHRQALDDAARALRETLICFDAEKLRRSQRKAFSVRPDHVKPLNFKFISEIEQGSSQAEQFVEEAMERPDWNATGAAFLLDEELHAWLRALVVETPDETDPAFQVLNTLSRWRINEALADSSIGGTKSLSYAPALGRTMEIDEFLISNWRTNYLQFARNWTNVLRSLSDNRQWSKTSSLVGPTVDGVLPALAAGVVLQLSERPSRKELWLKVGEFRDSKMGLMIREHLREGSTFPPELFKAVSEELLLRTEKRDSKRKSRLKWQTVFKVPLCFIETRFVLESSEDISQTPEEFLARVRRLLLGRAGSVLVSTANPFLANEALAEALRTRIDALIGPR